MAAKPARKPADPEPPTLAVPERPRSSDPTRVCIRIDGISYSIPADQVEAFRARYKGADSKP
jgi:hypothetical protein